MLSSLKNHPFAVEAFFTHSLVLTYAFPKEHLLPFIPECLELDTHEEKWGFLAVAMVQTKDLRPMGLPKFLGRDFFLIGYRIFARYTDQRGRRLRGLYILKSETNKRSMQYLGSLFTKYDYSTTDIQFNHQSSRIAIQSVQSDFELEVDNAIEAPALPSVEVFKSWKEARRFAGPMPFTFSYTPSKKEVLIVEGIRSEWTPRPVHVLKHRFSFLNESELDNGILANAFVIDNVPYRWKKGRTELWKG